MNENVKIDYDTAEKVMDLDGSKVYVKTIGDKTRADGVQRGRVTFDKYADDGAERIPVALSTIIRRPQVDEDHDDPGLQLGEVRRTEAAQAPGRLVPGPPPASETLLRRRALYCNTTQAWCPATHFGYQTQGTCKIKFEDGTETTINAGDSYLVDKPHLPEIIGDETVIMHEFSQQVKKVLDSMKD